MAWWVKNFWSEINRIVSCIGWLFQCDQDILVSSSPPTSPPPCLSYSSPSILLLLSIVFLSSWCLILLSSFAPLLRGAALLSIFIMRPGKKADRNRRETSSRSSPHSRLSESSWFQNASFSSIFNESSSVSRCFPKRFHSVLFDPLHLFLYLNFYFRLFFFFLQLRPDSFSLTPTHHLFFLLTNNGSFLFSGFHRPIWGSSWTTSSTVRWTKCPSSWKEASIPTTTTVTLVVRLHPR